LRRSRLSKTHDRPSVLVDTEWVAARLVDPSIVIVEVDSDLAANYSRGHVPGAVGWGLHTDLEDQVRRDIPGVAQMEGLLGRSGIGNDTTIVLYGDGNNRSATWAFWVLKYYRHRDVRLMNGGRVKWLSEVRPLSAVSPARPAKTYRVPAPDRSLRAMRDYIAASLGKPSFKVLDTRTREEYAGLLTSAPGTPQPDTYRKGRIPGAVHVPWEDAVAEDGTFRPVTELREMYQGKGLEPSDEVVPYCRLGVRASHSWFVLKYLLDYSRVRNSDGSWTEWGNASGLPIETDAPR
jgi:thiosulfate/3-mercaptopyruvate sulfurtransferase